MPKDSSVARLKVLVADDTQDNRLLLLYMLRRLGIEPDLVSNGQEAVEAVAKTDYDLILLDIQMPVMCGLEATKHLRSHGLKTPIVALTAHAMVDFQKEIHEAGFSSVVTKPFRFEDISKLISSVGEIP